MNEHKVEVLQVTKLNGSCYFTQRRTYGVQERSFTRNSIDKWYSQLFHVWRKNKTTT